MFNSRALWEGNVARFAAPATWTQAGLPRSIPVGYAVPREIDLAVANALGVGARMITIRAIDTGGAQPRKLDRLTVAGEQLTLDVVTPVVGFGQTWGWRCWCAGTGPGP